jgi:hypothetical protein
MACPVCSAVCATPSMVVDQSDGGSIVILRCKQCNQESRFEVPATVDAAHMRSGVRLPLAKPPKIETSREEVPTPEPTGSDHESYSEKRRYARHPGPFNALSTERENNELRIMNLGLGGCFVLVSSGHEVGETFQMQIDLLDQGWMEVSATTLYHTINGSAVTFMNLSQKAFHQIQRTVDASWAKPQAP